MEAKWHGSLLLLVISFPSQVILQTVNPSEQCAALCEYTHWALDADCKNRDLTSIPVQCSQVETFDLRHNQIRTLPVGVFQQFVKLRYLDIEMIELEVIEPGAFEGNVNLVNIYIQLNMLTVIRSFNFKGVPNLRQLFLNSNNIHELEQGAFDGIPKLETLFLSDNNISDISPDLFHNLTKLRYLYIENNRISTIREGTFKGLTNLRHLSLAGNDLVHIPAGAFDDLKHLKALKLSYNKIASISPLPLLPRLNHLDLYSNELTSVVNLTNFIVLPEASKRRRSVRRDEFTQMFLAKNPLNCDCEMEPLRIWIKIHHDQVRSHHRANATCALPVELSDISLCHQATPLCPIRSSPPLSTDVVTTILPTTPTDRPDFFEHKPLLMPLTIGIVCATGVVVVFMIIVAVSLRVTSRRVPYKRQSSRESESSGKGKLNITTNPVCA